MAKCKILIKWSWIKNVCKLCTVVSILSIKLLFKSYLVHQNKKLHILVGQHDISNICKYYVIRFKSGWIYLCHFLMVETSKYFLFAFWIYSSPCYSVTLQCNNTLEFLAPLYFNTYQPAPTVPLFPLFSPASDNHYANLHFYEISVSRT